MGEGLNMQTDVNLSSVFQQQSMNLTLGVTNTKYCSSGSQIVLELSQSLIFGWLYWQYTLVYLDFLPVRVYMWSL